MNAVDIVIIVFVFFSITRGASVGLVRQFFSLAGFLSGLLLGVLLAPVIASLTQGQISKTFFVLITILFMASVMSGLGEYLGLKLADAAKRYKASRLDPVLGAVFGAAVTLLVAWLLAAMLANNPARAVSQPIQHSKIIKTLDRLLPPAPPLIARIGKVINPNGFPQVFVGLEPTPAPPVNPANSADVEQAIKTDAASVVKIEGRGCGGIIDGSGFVAADNLVITNAHVVAGVPTPTVVDRNGRHATTAILFDPDLDIAVLKTSHLAGLPLPLALSDVNRGTAGVVLGYPGGGTFMAVPAGVLQEFIATGRNIYDRGLTKRHIYELQTTVEPGNSGGPLVLPDGTVIGVIFARSESTEGIGFSLTSTEVLPKIRQSQTLGQPVNTGPCAA